MIVSRVAGVDVVLVRGPWPDSLPWLGGKLSKLDSLEH